MRTFTKPGPVSRGRNGVVSAEPAGDSEKPNIAERGKTMAAGPYKLNLFFALYSNGWSETYYLIQGSQSSAYSQALSLVTVRQALMAAPTLLVAMRIADTSNLRNSQLYRFGLDGLPATVSVNPGAGPGYTSQADEVNVSADLTLYATNPVIAQRKIYLRGNPDSAYDTATPANADAVLWANNLTNFGNYLKGAAGSGNTSPVGIRYKPRPTFAGAPIGIPTNAVAVLNWTTTTPSADVG